MNSINFASELVRSIESCQSLAPETNKVWCDAVVAIVEELLRFDEKADKWPEEIEELLEIAYQVAREEAGLDAETFTASDIWRSLKLNDLEAAENLFDELYYRDDGKISDLIEGEGQEILAEIIANIVNDGYWHIAEKYLSLPPI